MREISQSLPSVDSAIICRSGRLLRIDLSRPGKPSYNAHVEAFNGTFRAECLNTHWFMTLSAAKEIIEA